MHRSKSQSVSRTPQTPARFKRLRAIDDDGLSRVKDWEDSPSYQLAAHCLHQLLPARVITSLVGPISRASMVVTSSKVRMAVLVLWNCDTMINGTTTNPSKVRVRVVPLIDDASGMSDFKEDRDVIASSLQIYVKDLLEGVLGSASISYPAYLHYYYMSNYISNKAPRWTTKLETLFFERIGEKRVGLASPQDGAGPWSSTKNVLKALSVHPQSTLSYLTSSKYGTKNGLVKSNACRQQKRNFHRRPKTPHIALSVLTRWTKRMRARNSATCGRADTELATSAGLTILRLPRIRG